MYLFSPRAANIVLLRLVIIIIIPFKIIFISVDLLKAVISPTEAGQRLLRQAGVGKSKQTAVYRGEIHTTQRPVGPCKTIPRGTL